MHLLPFVSFRLKSIKGIFVYGEPMVSVVGLGSNDFNIFRLFDALVEKSWNLNSLQFPSRFGNDMEINSCLFSPLTNLGISGKP